MAQPLTDEPTVVIAVALAAKTPAWVTRHYCCGLGPFTRSASIFAATLAQVRELQANSLLHVAFVKPEPAPEPTPTPEADAPDAPVATAPRKARK